MISSRDSDNLQEKITAAEKNFFCLKLCIKFLYDFFPRGKYTGMFKHFNPSLCLNCSGTCCIVNRTFRWKKTFLVWNRKKFTKMRIETVSFSTKHPQK